jgi:shikimate dehydrogenase
MKVTGTTKIVGLIGDPVSHSISPEMHNAAFSHLNLDYCYVPFPVKPDMLGQAVDGLRALNVVGANVTVPHKERILPLLDEISPEAAAIEAVNTIANVRGKLVGHNTDGRGFMRSLEDSGIKTKQKNILIIGAGGAARAIGYYLCQECKALYIYNRTLARAERLRQHLTAIRANVFSVDDGSFYKPSFLPAMNIIINATPLGLLPDDPLPINPALLSKAHIVCDLIYFETPLLQEARKRRCKAINGLGMLLWQGVLAFEIWTGIAPPVEIMRKTLKTGRNG